MCFFIYIELNANYINFKTEFSRRYTISVTRRRNSNRKTQTIRLEIVLLKIMLMNNKSSRNYGDKISD